MEIYISSPSRYHLRNAKRDLLRLLRVYPNQKHSIRLLKDGKIVTKDKAYIIAEATQDENGPQISYNQALLEKHNIKQEEI